MTLDIDGARETASAVRAGRVSAVGVAQAALGRIEARNGKLNAYRQVLAERALREAAAVDASVAAGRGAQAGSPGSEP